MHISRLQFPIWHRNATTMHKTQGLSLDSAIVDLHGKATDGKHYVIFSRFTTTTNLQVIGYDPKMVKTNLEVKQEMAKLRKNSLLLHPKPLYLINSESRKLCIFYQNSLLLHPFALFEDTKTLFSQCTVLKHATLFSLQTLGSVPLHQKNGNHLKTKLHPKLMQEVF